MDKKDIKPGEWFKVEEQKGNLPEKALKEEPKLEFSPHSIAVYTAFRDQVYNPSSVLYPSCGFDASPAKVFKKVTFVDVEAGNVGCITKLQRAGYSAVKQDIRKYKPQEEHDLLILLNPSVLTEWASKHLKSGGYILANNYHNNASQMHQKPEQFTLYGLINSDEKGVEVSRDITDLFVPVKSGKELKKLRPQEYDFITRCYSNILKNSGIVPERKFELLYAQVQRIMGLSERLPYRRVADRYIFVKK